MRMQPIKIWVERLWPLMVVCLAWLISFWGFVSGKLALVHDAQGYCRQIYAYMTQIVRGVYPIWNPFGNWGQTQELSFRFFGEFNPFLWILPILDFVIPTFHQTYLVYLVMYFFICMSGFFALSKVIFSDGRYALFSTVLLSFSSVAMTLFNDFAIILLMTPSVWFFYFLIAFTRTYEKRHLFGLTLAIMIIAITYLPFYFMTVFFLFLTGYAVLYWRMFLENLKGYAVFVRENVWTTVLSVVAVVSSLIPGLRWYVNAVTNKIVVVGRQTGADLQHAAGVGLDLINSGGTGKALSLRDLLVPGQTLAINDHMTFFVGVLSLVVLMVSVLNRINRRMMLLAWVCLMTFFISLAEATPIHVFLYDHVVFFKMFRNIYYLMYLCMPVFFLFVTEQLRVFLEDRPFVMLPRWGAIVYTIIVGIAATGVLVNIRGDAASLIVVWGVCAVLGLTMVLKRTVASSVILCVLAVLTIGQSMHIFLTVQKNSQSNQQKYFIQDEFTHSFSYTRPRRGEPVRRSEGYQDNSGFYVDDGGRSRYKGGARSLQMVESIDQGLLGEYVRHKLVLYDQVYRINSGQDSTDLFSKFLSNQANVALVEHASEDLIRHFGTQKGASSQYMIVDEKSSMVQVKDFDYNMIRLNVDVPRDKFLVYNDNWFKGWRAYIDGEAVPIDRSNISFKGIHLPQGRYEVVFRYGTVWYKVFVWFLMMSMLGLLMWLVYSFRRELNPLRWMSYESS